jgi:heptose I phosphotransferase
MTHSLLPNTGREAIETAATIAFDLWDDGRLQVNRRFADLLRAHGLTTCAAFLEFPAGDVVRRVGSRETLRLKLGAGPSSSLFYLKRHGPPRWRDRVMPRLHGSRPIHGARNEWEAILRFAAAGIPSMTPVAFGESGPASFVVTQGLNARCDLLQFVGGRDGKARSADAASPPETPARSELRVLIERVAGITRRMHAAGFHHQDFYLNHLLLCDEEGGPHVRVIDLGRVRRHQRLAMRWIIKDLAQLDFSARRLSCRERLRFLRAYLGRPFAPADRRLIRRVAFKSRRIAAHTAKHRL